MTDAYVPYPQRCSVNVCGQDAVLDALAMATVLADKARRGYGGRDPARLAYAVQDLSEVLRDQLKSMGAGTYWECSTHRAWIGGDAPGTLCLRTKEDSLGN